MSKDTPEQTMSGDIPEQAIRKLLGSVPETWAEYDPAALTGTDERGLCMLVAAGMVEQRSSFRVRMFGQPVVVKGTLTATGECGVSEAMRRVAVAVWGHWGAAWQAWKEGPTKDDSPLHCERIGREQWRLTAVGVQARAALNTEAAAVVFDFVLKRGLFGQSGQRPPVRGKGALEKLELVKADAPAAGPALVNVANWADGVEAFAGALEGPLEELLAAMREWLLREVDVKIEAALTKHYEKEPKMETQDGTLLLSAKDTAKTLGISRRTLGTLTADGVIPAVRLGRRVLYSRAALVAWIADQAAKDDGVEKNLLSV